MLSVTLPLVRCLFSYKYVLLMFFFTLFCYLFFNIILYLVCHNLRFHLTMSSIIVSLFIIWSYGFIFFIMLMVSLADQGFFLVHVFLFFSFPIMIFLVLMCYVCLFFLSFSLMFAFYYFLLVLYNKDELKVTFHSFILHTKNPRGKKQIILDYGWSYLLV